MEINNNYLPKTEEEDPDPRFNPYHGPGETSEYGTDERRARENLEFFKDRHFDEEHCLSPDSDCKICKDKGLVGRVLH